jgi:hypothetical protein
MIVRDEGTHWLLITQPDHARLARRVMEPWPSLMDAPRREEILLAIGEHDSAWAGPDSAPLWDPVADTVVDFVHAPLSTRQGGAPGAIARLTYAPWAAALVAQHGLTVYQRFRGEPEWQAFFAELERSRRGRLDVTGLGEAQLADDYAFVRLGDLISLSFCTGWTTVERFAGWAVACVGTRVRVEPFAHRGRIAMEVEGRRLPKRRYASDSELRRAVAESAVTILAGEVVL